MALEQFSVRHSILFEQVTGVPWPDDLEFPLTIESFCDDSGLESWWHANWRHDGEIIAGVTFGDVEGGLRLYHLANHSRWVFAEVGDGGTHLISLAKQAVADGMRSLQELRESTRIAAITG
jgi:hypothetical protein